MKSLSILLLILTIGHQKANSQQIINEGKPTAIFFHTDWCSYCKIQQKQIEKDSALNDILKNEYNFIDFNAESQQKITFNGKIYKSVINSTHDFAKSFFKKEKQIGYPAWVILDENYKIIFSHQGLIKVKDLKEILNSKNIKASEK